MVRSRWVLLFSPLMAFGCGGDEAPPKSKLETASDAGLPPPPAVGPCDDGEERKCKITLPSINGVAQCFVGMQYCVDGEWGPCDGETE